MEKEQGLVHADITAQVVRAFFDVYNELGFGFLENVYKRAMVVLLKERGYRCDVEAPLPIRMIRKIRKIRFSQSSRSADRAPSP